MDNQGRRNDQIESSTKMVFISLLGIVVLIILAIVGYAV